MIPDFQVHGMVSNKMTGAATLTICPIVRDANRSAYEKFTSENYYQWMEESHKYDERVSPELFQLERNENFPKAPQKESQRWYKTGIVDHIWKFEEGQLYGTTSGKKEIYFPDWIRSPAPDFSPGTNFDFGSNPVIKQTIEGMLEEDHPVLTEVTDAGYLLTKYDRRFPLEDQLEPHSYLLQPIYDNLTFNRAIVGFLSAFFRWGKFFENVLPEYETGIIIVLYGSCGQAFSYVVNGYEATFLGNGDLHDTAYESLQYEFEISPFAKLEGTPDKQYCQYSARIFPSDAWKERYYSDSPLLYAAGTSTHHFPTPCLTALHVRTKQSFLFLFKQAVVLCFVVTAIFFLVYDYLVQKRQAKVMDTATRSSAIVSNLFPATVRDRMMEEALPKSSTKTRNPWLERSGTPGNPVINGTCNTSEKIFGSRPLADHFPER